ncbi:MAG: serine dehydratase beta chain, partial [Clostridia bacterium]
MNIFNIIGPVMIGPSSSHTAGAARIGKVASIILGAPVKSARVFFSGSFASTYKGHGTDRAVAGGLMGFMPYDQRIRNSLSLAE